MAIQRTPSTDALVGGAAREVDLDRRLLDKESDGSVNLIGSPHAQTPLPPVVAAGHEAKVKDAPKFEPLDRNDPRFVKSLRVRPVEGPTQEARVRSFAVTFLDAHKRPLDVDSPGVFDMHFTIQQDVIDLLPYYEKDGNLFVIANENLRPAVAARTLDAPTYFDRKPIDGWVTGIPAAYMRPEDDGSVQSVVGRILKDKVGAEAAGPKEPLGASYYPSAGSLAERVDPYAIRVAPPEVEARVRYGAGFEGALISRAIEVRDVVRGYLAGEIQDVRLVELALRLARRKGLAIDVDLPLAEETKGRNLDAIADRIVSAADLKAIIHGAKPLAPGAITGIELQELTGRPPKFLEPVRLEIENVSPTGEVLHRYGGDLVRRKGRDAVDALTYFWKDGSLYLAVKLGVRPPIKARDLIEHPLPSRDRPLNLEGVAGSGEGTDTKEAHVDLARREIEEELHLSVTQPPVLASAAYVSPGTSPERAYQFLAEIDPTQPAAGHQTGDEVVGSWFVELNQLLDMVDDGTLRDPRLALGAHLLAAATKYPVAR
ncbi:MAG: hypothetical protein IT384_10320 [Deltaproteobacteria bacterium]|nr:hypothetical protein [Deltaproteobacteria bacterium]